MMRRFAALLAMVAILAACSSDDETTATTGDAGSNDSAQTEGEGSSDDDSGSSAGDGDSEMADSDDDGIQDDDAPQDDDSGGEAMDEDDDGIVSEGESTADGDSDGVSDDDSDAEAAFGGSLLIGDFLLNLFSGEGVGIDEDVIDCVADSGVDVDASVLDASEAQLNLASAALFGCAPDEMAAVLAAETEPPPGLDSDDVTCVMAETFRYLGTLSPEDTLSAMDADEIPADIRDEVEDRATDICGLSGDQVESIFDA